MFFTKKEKTAPSLTPDFDKIVRENSHSIYSLAFSIVKNKPEAEDICQEVFIKFYTSYQKFRWECKPSTLLYRICYNHSLDFLKKRKLKTEELKQNFETKGNFCIEEFSFESSENSNKYTKEQKFESLEKAINGLPAEEQILISLFYKEEKSIEEISKITSISQSNTKVKLHRIRKKLQTLIGENNENNEDE